MRLFGLVILSESAFERRLIAEVKQWRETRYEPNLKARDDTIAQLRKQVDDVKRTVADRPRLVATLEQGKRNRWRYVVKRPEDDKLIALPHVRGFAEKNQAREMVDLLSNATIEVAENGD